MWTALERVRRKFLCFAVYEFGLSLVLFDDVDYDYVLLSNASESICFSLRSVLNSDTVLWFKILLILRRYSNVFIKKNKTLESLKYEILLYIRNTCEKTKDFNVHIFECLCLIENHLLGCNKSLVTPILYVSFDF